MNSEVPEISVCICTFKRPELLKRTLESVCAQEPSGLFKFLIVVADNDGSESARPAVLALAVDAPVPIKYCVQPQQNIALTRNKAVANATGQFVAFIDDDEFAEKDWLLTLFKTIVASGADGVLGPVEPFFGEGTPQWIIEGKFYARPVHPTGMQLKWRQCRTGNVLLKRELFQEDEAPFNPACLSGEDQDFFRRQIEKGRTFIWCHEAPAFEVVPAVRWKRSFLAKRALFRGIFSQRNHGAQPLRLLQALIAVPAYALALPAALVLGQARFMMCVFKLSYFTGRLLGFIGINPIRQSYVVE